MTALGGGAKTASAKVGHSRKLLLIKEVVCFPHFYLFLKNNSCGTRRCTERYDGDHCTIKWETVRCEYTGSAGRRRVGCFKWATIFFCLHPEVVICLFDVKQCFETR